MGFSLQCSIKFCVFDTQVEFEIFKLFFANFEASGYKTEKRFSINVSQNYELIMQPSTLRRLKIFVSYCSVNRDNRTWDRVYFKKNMRLDVYNMSPYSRE
jgi:hypothetical protein